MNLNSFPDGKSGWSKRMTTNYYKQTNQVLMPIAMMVLDAVSLLKKINISHAIRMSSQTVVLTIIA
jgi:hypothetical protein